MLEARRRCPVALESLAAFLTVAGASFDQAGYAHYAHLADIFKRIDLLTSDKSVTPRERFLLRDVLDLRRAGWSGHGSAARPSPPMRLEEVRSSEGSPLATRSGGPPSRQLWPRSPEAQAQLYKPPAWTSRNVKAAAAPQRST